MKVIDTPLAGLKVIELNVFGDERGFFMERFNAEKFKQAGLSTDFQQDNHSRSAPHVLRGLHYQYKPEQGKLVGCAHGRLLDVAVDIRHQSPTFGQSYSVELSDTNGKLFWIPAGFAHGFCVLGDKPADLFYKVTTLYNPTGEGGIAWNDPDLAIDWGVKAPIISARDQEMQSFASYKQDPIF
ncbi:MAG: dTDP-4-dehydrorhamnose 3,5-epimerase [Alphaproteobacteria bacterium]